MVSDLIDRQAAMVVFENSGLDDDSKDTAMRLLEQLPPAQPQRKKGTWINDCTCSVCHWIHEDYKGFALITNYNYCPRCGAKMDGESDDKIILRCL